MSRRSKIIELALAKSEITNNNADANITNCYDEDVSVEGRMPRMPSVFLETGNDLLHFKHDLRQRTPVKKQNELFSVSNETEEIYSPVVSEYLPPEENTPSVLTPDADTESINEQIAENFTNEQRLEDILHDIEQNEVQNSEEQLDTPNEQLANEQSSTSKNQKKEELEQNETQNSDKQLDQLNKELANEEQPTTSNKIKKYPKKVTPGRKRVLNKENWKNSICKKKKNLGEEYTNKKGQFIPKKVIKPSCGDNCSRKCSVLKTENQRRLIFKNFWKLGDHNKQMDYISRFVKRVQKNK